VHYYIGLDLGQAQDYTALAFLEEALWLGDEVDWDSWGVYWPDGIPRSGGWVSPSVLSPQSALRALYVNYHLGRPPHPPLYLRHLERYELGTKYTEIVKRLLLRSPIRERLDYSRLLIDSTGVGRPVVDSFKAEGFCPISITIHGGSAVTHQLEGPLLDGLRVPKRDLVAAVQTLLQNGRLQIAEALELAEVLKRELLSFRVKLDPRTAHDSYEHWREQDHDDLVLAVACAAWYREYTNREIEARNHRQGGYRVPLYSDPSAQEFIIDQSRRY
jgi:hypothetical protein